MIFNLIKFETLIAKQKLSDKLVTLAFYLIASAIFVFALGSKTEILNNSATAIIWLCFLLTSTISMTNIFAEDYKDGTLEQLLMRNPDANSIIIGKYISYYLLNIAPLIFTSPLIAIILNLTTINILAVLSSLIFGSLIISAINLFAASLTIGNNKSALILIIALPFTIPVIILAIIAANNLILQNSLELFMDYFKIIIYLDLIMVPVFLIGSSYSIKHGTKISNG